MRSIWSWSKDKQDAILRNRIQELNGPSRNKVRRHEGDVKRVVLRFKKAYDLKDFTKNEINVVFKKERRSL